MHRINWHHGFGPKVTLQTIVLKTTYIFILEFDSNRPAHWVTLLRCQKSEGKARWKLRSLANAYCTYFVHSKLQPTCICVGTSLAQTIVEMM